MITIKRYETQSFTQAEEEAVVTFNDAVFRMFEALGFEDLAVDEITEDLFNYLDGKMVDYIKVNNSVKKRLTK